MLGDAIEQVALGEDADHLAAVGHRHRADPVLGQAPGGIAHGFLRGAVDDLLLSSGDQSGNRHIDSPLCRDLNMP